MKDIKKKIALNQKEQKESHRASERRRVLEKLALKFCIEQKLSDVTKANLSDTQPVSPRVYELLNQIIKEDSRKRRKLFSFNEATGQQKEITVPGLYDEIYLAKLNADIKRLKEIINDSHKGDLDALESETASSEVINHTERTPPIAEFLLSKLIPPDQRECVLGDLEEEYAIRRENSSLSAKLWYYCQAFSAIRLGFVALFRKVIRRRS